MHWIVNLNTSSAAAALGDNEVDDSDDDESTPEGAKPTNAAHRVTPGRSYCAVAMIGVALATAPAPAAASVAVKPLKRLVRPGEVKPAAPAAVAPQLKKSEPRVAAPKSLDQALRTTARAVDSGASVSL